MKMKRWTLIALGLGLMGTLARADTLILTPNPNEIMVGQQSMLIITYRLPSPAVQAVTMSVRVGAGRDAGNFFLPNGALTKVLKGVNAVKILIPSGQTFGSATVPVKSSFGER